MIPTLTGLHDLDALRDHLVGRILRRIFILGSIVLAIDAWQLRAGPRAPQLVLGVFGAAVFGWGWVGFFPMTVRVRIFLLEGGLLVVVLGSSLISGFVPGAVGGAAVASLLAAFLLTSRAALFVTGASIGCLLGGAVWHVTFPGQHIVWETVANLASATNWVRTSFTLLGLSVVPVLAMVQHVRSLGQILFRERCLLDTAKAEEDRRQAAVEAKAQADAERRRGQSLLAVGQLSGGFSHECSNRLQVIRGEVDWLAPRGQTACRGVLQEALGEMREAIDAADAVLQRLLAMSGRDVPRTAQPTEVAAFLRAAQRQLANVPGLHVVVEAGVCPSVLADVPALHGVLLNLALNARDAMGDGGTLRVRTREPSDEERSSAQCAVAIDIVDTGHGMAAATMARLFEPFFTTKGRRGTGLGLYSARRVLEAAGGALRVDSAPGVGTTFTMLLPEAKAPALLRAEPATTTSPVEGAPVLVVDDDPAVRRGWCRNLGACGFRVFEASNVEEALVVVREHRIVFALMDAVMPGRPTRDLVDELCRLQPDAHRVVCSGHVDEELLRRRLLCGEADFLAKPCPLDVVVDRARRAAVANARAAV